MLLLTLLFACVPSRCGAIDALPEADAPRVLAMGDSLLGWNHGSCQSIPDHTAAALDISIDNRAVNGSTLTGIIPSQYSDEAWDVVIVDGGANDLNRGCECGDCDTLMDQLVSADGSRGRMPDLVDGITADGADVLLIGYYHLRNGAWYGFDRCTTTIEELDRRHARLADQRENVHFFDLDDVFGPTDGGGPYAFDKVHPSPKGARLVGEALADALGPLIEP